MYEYDYYSDDDGSIDGDSAGSSGDDGGSGGVGCGRLMLVAAYRPVCNKTMYWIVKFLL